MKRGKWIFTCSLEPKQFDSFDEEKDPNDYSRDRFTDEEWESFSKYDDFTTIEGSSHSVKNCGCVPVSKKYALWFIKNECHKLFIDDGTYNWDAYKKKIKEKCKLDGIRFEGW